MRDDEKMFNIGFAMLVCVVIMVSFLQVCYRVQNNNLKAVRSELVTTKQKYDIAKTQFSALSSAKSLRDKLIKINPRAESVVFSKNVNIDNIPMVK